MSKLNAIFKSGNENDNDNASKNQQTPLLPALSTLRSPLNTIPDPCQSGGATVTPARVWGLHKGKSNSATSTPARCTTAANASRVSNVHTRALHLRAGTVFRSVSDVKSEDSPLQVPHFELVEDPSFWDDHNVQVLIRIRPLSDMEKVSQGYGTCLKQESPQTLVWLGHPETRFTFDHVACQTISQEKLFRIAGLPMVDNCMSGYNSCMFAYGQTGSGKTYTMMGEIGQVDGKLDQHCGITPRIFQYLFTRIKEEEENRRSEGLKYCCKCSFLEIYNEQITDLLEPSSTNLQLREDLKKGVYVENLSEYNVQSANDVITLLQEGATNRKMAATRMNSESSRSHSVFTCIIESHWEKDSMNHFRFARLNLVDLAGSERQKSSGAEGDRLKEAVNINKSLSTLGLVIMSLVDLAHGKQRHVPYRDSRLTFLLQDSLGGNSKTTIIANVSPSICSANETLSTLKFAQRAKLIQNNAKVNEDASGDVTALQRQIQQLKGQLNFLMKNQVPSKHHSEWPPSTNESCGSYCLDTCDSLEEIPACDDDMATSGGDGKVKRLKTTLLGALRREKLAEMELRRLKTELEQTKHLVHQREEDAERTKMMLTFQQERLKKLELCADGLLSADKYLLDENNALREEIQILQARENKNSDITKLELENARLLQQLNLVLDFYEQGERDTLLAELSELRNQFLELLESEGCCWQPQSFPAKDKQNNVAKELEECRNMNSRLIREADELQRVLDRHKICNQDKFDSVRQLISCLNMVQALSIETDQRDDLISYKLPEDHALLSKQDQTVGCISILQYEEIKNQLVDARSLIETMESKQARLLEELEFIEEENRRLTRMLNMKEMGRQPGIKCKNYSKQSSVAESQHQRLETMVNEDVNKLALQTKLDKMSKDLEEALSLNNQYLEDHASRLSQDCQVELVRDEVEMETAKTILYLQEELVALQSEFEEKYSTITEENVGLRKTLAAKDDEIRALSAKWERAILELTSFLLDGSKSLRDASHQIEGIAYSFPHVNVWIGEHVEKAAKICIQKEETILLLQHSLEEAQKTVLLMEQKLNALKGATIALTELQQPENDVGNEISQLITVFDGDSLEKKVKCSEDQNAKAEKYADAACSTRHNMEGNMPFTEKDGDCSSVGLSSPGPLAVLMEDEHIPIQNGCDQPIMSETNEMVEYHDLITKKANASGNNTIKLDAGDGFVQATSFFTKIEEAHATMKEADHMLKALLKKNENEKYLTFMWKQAGEELQFEKASLVQEIEQLKSSVAIKEGENEILQDQISLSLLEIANSIALLDGAFECMQRDVVELCKVAYFDASRMVRETLNGICSSRVMLDDIFTKAMENEITSCFLECHVKDFIQRFRSINANCAICPVTPQFELLEMKNAGRNFMSYEDRNMVKFMNWPPDREETATIRGSEGGELIQIHGDPENENLELKKELERKEVLLKGLLFDFRLLQESASSRQDLKDEFEKLINTVNQVQYELQIKTSELDDLLHQHRSLEDRLSMTENALTIAKSDLEHAIETSNALSEQNADMRVLLKDLFLKKSKAEEQLEEKKEVIRSLEEEILRLTSSTEKQLASSVKEDDLRRVTEGRDKLLEQLKSLQVRLEMALTLADENEAIAVEARQESETSKIYAEQKEEEVKILERSVEELECTINVMEKKVYEMEDEVQRQNVIKESLELEIQALRDRLSTVENLTESFDSEDLSRHLSRGQILRSVEVNEAQRQIKFLEEEKAELVKEIKQCKEYISELVLHAEAQASKYQEKYKHLEAMVNEVKTDSSNMTSGVSSLEKTEKTSTRTRGSGSPFRCITNLVQQMNLEKDQELSMANVRIEELEALAASRQKEVCILNGRLAAAESMTHDVIRDLLGVKLDMTNYANLADQYQLQKLVEEAQQRKQECDNMEKENFNLRRQVVDLIEERERCILDVNRREADILAAHMTLEQLKERDQLLTAQNEMLKADKTNLLRRVAELDDIVKSLFGTQDIQSRNQQTMHLCRENSRDLIQRPSHWVKQQQQQQQQQQQLLQVDELLARPRRLSCTNHHRKKNGHENET